MALADDRNAQKTGAALVSIAASGGLTVAKLAAGLASGSLSLLAEALHSLLDFGATVLTYLAIRLANRPADEIHTYGHGKVESLAAFAETAFLLGLSGWIGLEAIGRLFGAPTSVSPNAWVFAVIVVAIGVDVWRVRALRRAAKETGSQALEADALHFGSDLLGSAAVLAGLVGVALGYARADAVAALAVSAVIILAGLGLGRRTIAALLDAAPEGAPARVRELAEKTPGVVSVERIRVRAVGSILFIDIDVTVSRLLPLDHVVEIKRGLAARIHDAFPEAELTIVASPVTVARETVIDRVAHIARNSKLMVHHVTAQTVNGRLAVGLDLEVDGRLPLAEAHATATRLEEALRAEFGDALEIETHIEPLQTASLAGMDADAAERQAVIEALNAASAASALIDEVHDIRVRETERGLYVTFHCRAKPSTSVEDVHDAISAIEAHVREQVPRVKRIIAHAEPMRPRVLAG